MKGTPEFEPRWPNRRAAWAGFLTAMGRSSASIGAELGVSPAVVRTMWQHWRFPSRRKVGTAIPITLSTFEIVTLEKLAGSRGLEPHEWLRQVAAITIRDDLFNAVVGEGEG